MVKATGGGVGVEEKVVMEEGGLGDSLLGTRKDGKHSLDRREDVWREWAGHSPLSDFVLPGFLCLWLGLFVCAR